MEEEIDARRKMWKKNLQNHFDWVRKKATTNPFQSLEKLRQKKGNSKFLYWRVVKRERVSVSFDRMAQVELKYLPFWRLVLYDVQLNKSGVQRQQQQQQQQRQYTTQLFAVVWNFCRFFHTAHVRSVGAYFASHIECKRCSREIVTNFIGICLCTQRHHTAQPFA